MLTIKSVLRKCQDFASEPGWLADEGYRWINTYPPSLFRKQGYSIEIVYSEKGSNDCGSMIQISCRESSSHKLLIGLELLKTADGTVRPTVFPRTKGGALYQAGDALDGSEYKRASHLFDYVQKRARDILDEEMHEFLCTQ